MPRFPYYDTPGETAYAAYFTSTNGLNTATGEPRPSWDELTPESQAAWNNAAEAVKLAYGAIY